MKAIAACILAATLAAVPSIEASYPHRDTTLVFPPEGCTAILVDHAGSLDGGMTTHTNDCTDCDFRLSLVPARDYEEGAKRPVMVARFSYPRYIGDLRGDNMRRDQVDRSVFDWKDTGAMGYIPQVSHTYSYIDGVYGIMNENQVSMGESTCGARIVASPISAGGKALFDVSELGRIALERSKTAREACEIMGGLASKYGFYGAEWTGDFAKGEAGEALTVVDPTESWVFHILADVTGASATWVSKRVPKGHITSVANSFTIQEVDCDDKDNFICSPNLLSQAIENNFWQPSWGPFNFAAVYGETALFDIYCSRRMWRIFDLVAPSLKLNANLTVAQLPFSVKPERTLNKHDLMEIQRDHYEGTEFDLTKGLAAGPYGNPNRYDRSSVSGVPANVLYQGVFERAISLFRTAYAFVATARNNIPNELTTLWFSPSIPHSSFFMPLFPFSHSLPTGLTTGHLYQLSHHSTWWASQALGNYLNTCYMYIIVEIQSAQKQIQEQADADYVDVTQQALSLLTNINGKKDSKQAQDLLTNFQNKNAAQGHDAWWALFYHIITKYHDGQRLDDFHAETIAPVSLFYPMDWLQKVGFWSNGMDASVTEWTQTHIPPNRPTPPSSKTLLDTMTTQTGWYVEMSQVGWICSVIIFACVFLGLGMLLERNLRSRKENAYAPINNNDDL